MPTEISTSLSSRFARAKVLDPKQHLFPEISYAAFAYSGDEEALSALKSVPGAAQLLTWLNANYTEQIAHVENNENLIRVGTKSFPSLHSLLLRCCEVLSCPAPDLYISSSPIIDAYTSGHRKTHVVLSRGIIDLLSADELSFVIGHELGHIKAGHGTYRALGLLLTSQWDLITGLIPIPGLGLLRTPLLLAYWEWFRRSEFTCDRAGLLCVQDIQPSMMALAKLAGSVAGLEEEFDLESIIGQVEATREVNKLVQVLSILNNLYNTHPLIPLRLRCLREYAASGDLQRLVKGDYKRDALGLHEGGERVTCRCGTIVNTKLAFCPECGRELRALLGENNCEQCETVLPAGTKFCPKCGKQQSEAGVPATSTLAKLRNSASSFFKQ
jgi:Zn-dependent protease with chaperone function/RNA polymerase subunit RPABC4/transcription elongation factor Spt4